MTKEQRNTINLIKKRIKNLQKQIEICMKQINNESNESFIRFKRQNIAKYRYAINEDTCIIDTLQNQWQREEDIRRFANKFH